MKKYYLHDGKNQHGPYSIEELAEIKLEKQTPVWYEGLTDWTTAGSLPELSNAIKTTPPPFKVAAPPLQTVTHFSEATVKSKKSSSLSKVLTTVGILALLVLGIAYLYNLNQGQAAVNTMVTMQNEEESRKAEYRNNITKYVIAERNTYQYSELGGISNLEISVSNNTDYLVDKVTVRIFYYKPNGDVWNTRDVDFNMLEGNHKYTLKIPDTNRGVKVEYDIIAIKSNVLGLN